MNEAVSSSAEKIAGEGRNLTFRGRNCSVWWRAKRLKRTLTINILILLSRPALSSSKEQHRHIRHHQEQKIHVFTLWPSFGLTQIPQVVMNIDYKLEPISGKNVGAYFHNLKFNTYAKLMYCFNNHLSILLQIIAFLGFIKTAIQEIKYICKKWFTPPSYFVK